MITNNKLELNGSLVINMNGLLNLGCSIYDATFISDNTMSPTSKWKDYAFLLWKAIMSSLQSESDYQTPAYQSIFFLY